MGTAAEALQVVQRLCEAWDAEDWETFGAQYHEDSVFEFVSQGAARGRQEIIDYERSTRVPGMRLTRDLWAADDSGRVWWRYVAEWIDPDSGERRSTSGASTALVVDQAIVSLTSWIDLSFLLTAPDDATTSGTSTSG